MSGHRMHDYCIGGCERERVHTAGPSSEKLCRGIEREYSLFQLHQPTVKAGQDR